MPLVLGLSLVGYACGGSEKVAGGAPKSAANVRPENLEHEACSETGRRVETLDTNNDGKVDIRRVLESNGRPACTVVDLNHDGHPDLYEYFDSDGKVRRREFCYDDTGAVNVIEYYEAGKLVRRESDTTGQHKIDTWDWFDPNLAADPKTGRPAHPVRRERDTHGTGLIDQWWTWDGAKVTIATDRDADGQPDPASVLVLGGGEEAGAPPVASATSGEASGNLPSTGTGEAGAPAPAMVGAASLDGGPREGGNR